MAKFNFRSWLTWTLRKASFRWPPRTEALRLARVERGKYICAKCKKLHTNKQVSVDHIEPVIDPKTGFVSWDIFIARLFCEADGFQVLCNDCHDKKTAKERVMRKKKTHG